MWKQPECYDREKLYNEVFGQNLSPRSLNGMAYWMWLEQKGVGKCISPSPEEVEKKEVKRWVFSIVNSWM